MKVLLNAQEKKTLKKSATPEAKPEPKSKDYPDLDSCAAFKKDYEQVWDFSFIRSKEGVSGTKYVTYTEARIPFLILIPLV
uniref:Orf80, hypothetical mitochondrial protein n=1 Tax=Ectocarpus siliculosus TaxID=2880 RepID=E6ZEU0_ECTSI|nr:Putative orf80, mitochondrial hypothetical protein [Ectocarpus siliculosus]CBJ18032.1 Putative orf80, hypothetical mitochondrial protein [Ectocarpus siliculosus]